MHVARRAPQATQAMPITMTERRSGLVSERELNWHLMGFSTQTREHTARSLALLACGIPGQLEESVTRVMCMLSSSGFFSCII